MICCSCLSQLVESLFVLCCRLGIIHEASIVTYILSFITAFCWYASLLCSMFIVCLIDCLLWTKLFIHLVLDLLYCASKVSSLPCITWWSWWFGTAMHHLVTWVVLILFLHCLQPLFVHARSTCGSACGMYHACILFHADLLSLSYQYALHPISPVAWHDWLIHVCLVTFFFLK